MNNIPKELQELRASTETLIKKYKEIKGMPMSDDHPKEDMNDKMENKMKDMETMMFVMVNNIHRRISYLEQSFYDFTYSHTQNHLPNPSTPSDMQHCLDVLGLSKDYDVKKRTVYASINDGKGVLFDVIK